MKHVRLISQASPANADEFQQFICQSNSIKAGILDMLGGSLPWVTYIESKCNPSDESDTTDTTTTTE